jgi:hypothetical protein
LQEKLADYEKNLITSALQENEWNQSAAARRLKISVQFCVIKSINWASGKNTSGYVTPRSSSTLLSSRFLILLLSWDAVPA